MQSVTYNMNGNLLLITRLKIQDPVLPSILECRSMLAVEMQFMLHIKANI